VHERRLAHQAARHDAPGDAHRHRRGLQRLGAGVRMRGQQLTGQRVAAKVVRIGQAGVTPGRQLVAPDGDLFVVFFVVHDSRDRS
jgi:hypothetical protein